MKRVGFIALLLITCMVTYGVFMLLSVKLRYAGRPVIYITNDYFMWKGGDTYLKFQEFDPSRQYDVVVVGSSRAYRGYSPKCFADSGLTLFNLGTSAQSIVNTEIIVKNYVRPENTKLLVVDLYGGAFKASQLESSADLIENVGSMHAATDIAFRSYDPRIVNMYVLRMLTNADQPYYSKKDYSGSGFSEKHDSLPAKLAKLLPTFRQKDSADLIVDPAALNALDGILTFCDENKIPVVLVYSPVTAFYSRANHAVFTAAIAPVVSKHQARFLDYSKTLQLDTRYHFYDDTHLNSAGVELFNRRLIYDLYRH